MDLSILSCIFKQFNYKYNERLFHSKSKQQLMEDVWLVLECVIYQYWCLLVVLGPKGIKKDPFCLFTKLTRILISHTFSAFHLSVQPITRQTFIAFKIVALIFKNCTYSNNWWVCDFECVMVDFSTRIVDECFRNCSPTQIPIFTQKETKKHGVCMFYLYMCGFSLGTPISSQTPKAWLLG